MLLKTKRPILFDYVASLKKKYQINLPPNEWSSVPVLIASFCAFNAAKVNCP